MILSLAGIPLEIVPSRVEEDNGSDDPETLVRTHSMAKALDVAGGMPGRVVLGADTLVFLEGRVLGKPSGRAEAREMLDSLSGRWHEVHGGVAVILEDGSREMIHEVTRVKFRGLGREETEAYIDTGEPMDKAGAYGIQGFGGVFVERIEGCYFNVMGLPLSQVVRRLRRAPGA
jgi:septum formation protein